MSSKPLLPQNELIPGISLNRPPKKAPSKPPDPLFFTPEYKFYAFLTVTVVSFMIYKAWNISS
ncbi:hypothetical protein BB560_005262, partial [Smittium megazygosporum]